MLVGKIPQKRIGLSIISCLKEKADSKCCSRFIFVKFKRDFVRKRTAKKDH